MAKPIEETPVLRKKDKDAFLLAIKETEEKPNAAVAKFLAECFALYNRNSSV